MELVGPNSARGVFEALAVDQRVRYPSGYRTWAVANAEPIRPRMFNANPYIGVRAYTPTIMSNLLNLPGFSRDYSTSQLMQETLPFIVMLYNPRRLAYMIPDDDGWRESEAIFASSPRLWQQLLQKINDAKMAHTRVFCVRFRCSFVCVPNIACISR